MSHLLDPRHQAVLQSEKLVPLHVIAEATFRLGSEEAVYPITSAIVTLDRRRRQRTTADLMVTITNQVDLIGGLFTPHGTEVDLRAGIRLTDGTESMVALGERMVVTGMSGRAQRGEGLRLSVIERSERVVRWRFEYPFTVPAPVDLADVVSLVLNDRGFDDVDLDPIGVTLTSSRTFGLEAGKDPWVELSQLVEAFGWRLWLDRHGDVVLDQPPSTDELTARDVMIIAPDVDHSSTPPNVVVARFEPMEGTPRVGIAEDDDPSSPTFVGGPYGRVTHFYSSGLPVSQAGADQAAQSILDGKRWQGRSWTWGLAFDPTMDPDDLLRGTALDDDVDLLVDAATVDVAGAATTVEGREQP